MRQYIQRLTLGTAIALLSLVTVETPQAHGTELSIGKYALLKNKLQIISLAQREQMLASLSKGNEILLDATENPNTRKNQQLLNKIITRRSTNNQLEISLQQSVSNLRTAEQLDREITKYSPHFITKKSKDLLSADKINQDIEAHYVDLIDENTESISLIENQKLLSFQDNEVGTELNAESELNEQQLKQLEETIITLNSHVSIVDLLNKQRSSLANSKPLMATILLIFGASFAFMLAPVIKIFNEGIISDLQDKYGKPEVPEGSVFMHSRYLKELNKIATKAERLESEKFGDREFLLYVQIKKNIAQKTPEFKKLNESVELLRAGIAAQKSFLRLEQIELRFRSRKQQEFYQFVADNIDDNIDKQEFQNKVKKKLAKIIPLVNSDEGRDALQGYLKEVDFISRYEFGLKLLALFKKHQLSDYTILSKVSGVVDRLQGHELLAPKTLVSLVIEHYDVFEKLGLIIGISEAESHPETYAQILQLIGLISRHADSYQKFEQLLTLLKKWEKPYNSLMMIRSEYQPNEYRLPSEFKETPPGVNIYKKYAPHLQ
ncbi:MAG: hypothetical protein Tsb0014_37250 [Pleurocapsa sp.]